MPFGARSDRERRLVSNERVYARNRSDSYTEASSRRKEQSLAHNQQHRIASSDTGSLFRQGGTNHEHANLHTQP